MYPRRARCTDSSNPTPHSSTRYLLELKVTATRGPHKGSAAVVVDFVVEAGALRGGMKAKVEN